jgi:hypothetical protein
MPRLLNDDQILRLMQHACDKSGHDELSGSINYYFVEGGFLPFATDCHFNGINYRASVKFYDGPIGELDYTGQVYVVLRATAEAIYNYEVKALNRKPSKTGVKRIMRKITAKAEEPAEV